jgi:hypothetical protein
MGLVIIIAVVITIIVAVLLFNKRSTKQTYVPNNSSDELDISNKDYQYSNPDLKREGCYFSCLRDKCAGQSEKVQCSYDCAINCFSENVSTVQTRMCEQYKGDREQYAKCLIQMYSNNNNNNYFGGAFTRIAEIYESSPHGDGN